MSIATHNDIVRLFPGIQDLIVTKILSMHTTVNEIEAAMLLLQGDDKELIEIRNGKSARLNRLLELLMEADLQMPENFEK